MSEQLVDEVRPVSFGERVANSQVFADLFRDGMGLVEETASYLDGPGRKESKKLERMAALTYATESMRLTTRLMQLASWLLLQRAVNEGEMSAEAASSEKTKVKLGGLPSPTDGRGFHAPPEPLRHLIRRSLLLQQRVRRLDNLLHPQPDAAE